MLRVSFLEGPQGKANALSNDGWKSAMNLAVSGQQRNRPDGATARVGFLSGFLARRRLSPAIGGKAIRMCENDGCTPTRRSFLKKLGVASLGLASLFGICPVIPTEGIDEGLRKGKEEMAQTAIRAETRVGIPPMDLRVPERMETATFAMG